MASDGDVQKLADEINDSFYSVSTDLLPLDPSMIPDINVDGENLFVGGLSGFTIEPYQVERKLASVNPSKASGPDNVTNWFWRDFSVWLAEPLCAILTALFATVLYLLPGSRQMLSLQFPKLILQLTFTKISGPFPLLP